MVFHNLIGLISCILYVANARPSCDIGQYYDRLEEHCKSCTLRCPENTVVLVPCQGFRDTKCGLLKDFKLVKDISWDFLMKGDDVKMRETASPPTPATVGESDHWFTVSMFLLGALGLIAVLITIYAVATCIIFKRTNQKERIVFNPVYPERPPSEEPRYVEVFPTSRDRLKSASLQVSPSVLPLLQSDPNHTYINCDHVRPEVHSSKQTTSSDAHDYVYLD